MSSRSEEIDEIAIECADEAASVAAEGQLEVADPMRGDWDWVEDKMGKLSDEEGERFRRVYRQRLEEYVE